MWQARCRATLLMILLAGLLVACGGGTTTADGGIGGTGITTTGQITGFGSVFVNGVEYEVSPTGTPTATVVTLDGQQLDESALAVGMVVTLQGTLNADGKTGHASRIEYRDVLQGIVTANKVTPGGAGTLIVMGQNVVVDADTVYVNTPSTVAPNPIPLNAVLEISGYASGDGTVYATRIELMQSSYTGGEISVKGVISNLGTETFNLGGLTVIFDTDTALPQGGVSDGLYVEVKGTRGLDGQGRLLAGQVEIEGDGSFGTGGDEGEEIGMEGRVTLPYDGSSRLVQVNGQPVHLAPGVEFEPVTMSAGGMLMGVRVEIEGSITGGLLVVDKVRFRLGEVGGEAELQFQACVEHVGMMDLTVLGQTISVTGLTLMQDVRDDEQFFGLRTLNAPGDRVEVNLYRDGGRLLATKLVRRENEICGNVELEGEVDSVDPVTGQIVIGGVTIVMGGLSLPGAGERVGVTGVYADGLVTASELKAAGED